ncbi:EamA family transporter [Parafrigoribacterium mesophilum]|uniref:EamA family transporter n=1 Tax=Parafrigoribacterium mesophilum TaxID=433646 RepID=UPI0031FE26C2
MALAVGTRPARQTTRPSTLVLAVASAAAFGTSGPFVKPLLEAGWSPASAVAVRAGFGGVVLLIPALIALAGRFRMLLSRWRLIVTYGIVAVVGSQVFYFAAIERLPVGVALLIEYTAPVLLVLLAWARTRLAPAALTIIGAVVSIAGLVLVVKPAGAFGLDILGVLFALTAAVCVAGYFLISARPTGELPPVVLICSGLFVGAIALAIIGGIGLVPFTFAFEPVTLLGVHGVWWVVPMGVVVIVATAFAYLAGILSAAKLGSRVASFIGLLEVLFAILFAWWLLGEVPTLMQGLGGALIVAGIVLVKMERTSGPSTRTGAVDVVRNDLMAPPQA